MSVTSDMNQLAGLGWAGLGFVCGRSAHIYTYTYWMETVFCVSAFCSALISVCMVSKQTMHNVREFEMRLCFKIE